jgi:hypothetical protein
LEKPRAGSIEPYLLRSSATLSVSWLIRAVLDATQPIVEMALPEHREYAFLAGTSMNNVRPLLGKLRTNGVRQFQIRMGLDPVTLPELRQSRGIAEYNRTKNVFRVKRLLNQASIKTTLGYLDEHLTSQTDGIAIAEVQQQMLIAPAIEAQPRPNGVPASIGSHQCLNPHDPSQKHDENGFCASFLWPFNDRHFVFDFAARPVAFLLRDYKALCEAEKCLPTERFAKIYAARKRKIETDYLPRVNETLRRQALAIMKSLPPVPMMT